MSFFFLSLSAFSEIQVSSDSVGECSGEQVASPNRETEVRVSLPEPAVSADRVQGFEGNPANQNPSGTTPPP